MRREAGVIVYALLAVLWAVTALILWYVLTTFAGH